MLILGCSMFAIKLLTIDLLPKQISEHAGQHADGEVYVDEGLSPIPQRVVKRIVRGDFVKIEELLPELWSAAHQNSKGRSRRTGISLIYSLGSNALHCIPVFMNSTTPS